MKSFSDAALDALESGKAIVTGALAVMTSPDAFFGWGGYVPLELSDGNTYTGLGDRFMAQVSGGQLGSTEVGATVQLSGVDPDVLAGIDLEQARGVDAVQWRMIWDTSGTQLLQSDVYLRGTVDQLTQEDTAGGTSTITASIEGAARGLGRRSGRSRSDADQRLINPTDGGCSRLSYAGQKVLYLGGKPPAAAVATLPGVVNPANGAYINQLALQGVRLF